MIFVSLPCDQAFSCWPLSFHMTGVAVTNQTMLARIMNHLTLSSSMRPARKRMDGRIRELKECGPLIPRLCAVCVWVI